MRILINCSNLVVGGGIQVASSVITELKKNTKHIFTVVLSKEVANQINTGEFPANFKFYFFESTPAKLKTRSVFRKKLDEIEESNKINFVVTIFGPSYWKPKKAKHLCGFALPWMIYPKSVAYNKLTFMENLKSKLINYYKLYYFKKDCDFYWCETEIVKERMERFLGLKNIYVIGNTASHYFLEFKGDISDYTEFETFKMLTVSAYYPHKNLDLIKKIIPFIKQDGRKIKFYLTLPEAIFAKMFNSEELKYVENLGVVKNEDCPKLYANANAVFLPSLLECFSANYAEAMCIGRPILTSNLDFAKSICKGAAIYFDPQDPKDVYEKIVELMDNKNKQQNMVSIGKTLLTSNLSSAERANELVGVCEKNYNNRF
jgi:glycosyltransferase involved in cell wall biosynthesis